MRILLPSCNVVVSDDVLVNEEAILAFEGNERRSVLLSLVNNSADTPMPSYSDIIYELNNRTGLAFGIMRLTPSGVVTTSKSIYGIMDIFVGITIVASIYTYAEYVIPNEAGIYIFRVTRYGNDDWISLNVGAYKHFIEFDNDSLVDSILFRFRDKITPF